uniref:60 kDa chaperonin n=1 Tax=Dictyoglomus turgidum TaxID=513050 RepID=A0A7C3WQM4_9BACT
MKQRNIVYEDALIKLKKGVDYLANIVKCTLGPKGNNVIIERPGLSPLITKDGVTVAKEVFVKDGIENLGAQIVKEAALKTNEIAGDGTTTATVLSHSLITYGIKNIVAGANPIDLKRGMDIGVKMVVSRLQEISRKIESREDLINVASISANNDYEIGEIITDAIEKAGEDGVVIVEESKGPQTIIDVAEGMQFDRGYKSIGFINKKDSMEVELKNCYILIYNDILNNMYLKQIMEEVYHKGNSSLLVIANDFSDDILKLLLLNSVKGVLNCCAVLSPGYGDRRTDLLNDIAVFTGGTVFGDVVPITQATTSILGKAEKVVVSKDRTIIFGGKGDPKKIQETIEQIKTQINNTEIEYDKQKLRERLGKLTGGIVVLRVGAFTETELKEKKMRIEDALHATSAALEEGIVAGGGVALLRAREVLKDLSDVKFVKGSIEDQKIGINILYNSLEIPFLSICENAGLKGDAILKEVLDSKNINFGYDVLNNTFGDLFEIGVIDPVKVTRLSLENAVSVAGMFLTTKGIISLSDEEKDYIDRLFTQSAQS